LISYIIGDKADAIARQREHTKKQTIVDALRPGFGDVSGKISKVLSYYWGNDRYSQGAYGLYGTGQWFSLMPVLKRPHGSVHFAGEHLADWQGFMEGAIVSGEDAAEAIAG
jgi:monoamine oxidase